MASLVRLPRHFPVGTRYVVEGVPGDDGQLKITSRVVVLPNGTELALPLSPRSLAARMARRATTRSPRQRKKCTTRKTTQV
jgi:hypothetical protein